MAIGQRRQESKWRRNEVSIDSKVENGGSLAALSESTRSRHRLRLVPFPFHRSFLGFLTGEKAIREWKKEKFKSQVATLIQHIIQQSSVISLSFPRSSYASPRSDTTIIPHIAAHRTQHTTLLSLILYAYRPRSVTSGPRIPLRHR